MWLPSGLPCLESPPPPPAPASPMLKEGLVPRKAQQSSATSKDRAYLGEKVGNGCSSQARHLAVYWSATQRQQLCLIYLFVCCLFSKSKTQHGSDASFLNLGEMTDRHLGTLELHLLNLLGVLEYRH